MGLPIVKMATVGILPSFLKKLIYRIRGAKIGKGVKIGLFSIIESKAIDIADEVKIAPFSFIKVRSLNLGKRVKIGSMVAIETGKVHIGDDTQIMEQTVVGGMLTPRSSLTVGKRVKIFPYCFINPTEPVSIGNDVGVGGSTYIFTHGSWQSILEGFPIAFGEVIIEDGVWLPWRVFILPNVKIGQQATIGAGSVIIKSIPAHCLAAGVPAKVIRTENSTNTLSLDQKMQIFKKIIDEFKDYLIYMGYNVNVLDQSKRESYFTINLISILAVVQPYETNKAQIIVSLNKISDDLRKYYRNNSVHWFDLDSLETIYTKIKQWVLIKDFLSRYGIRFNRLD